MTGQLQLRSRNTMSVTGLRSVILTFHFRMVDNTSVDLSQEPRGRSANAGASFEELERRPGNEDVRNKVDVWLKISFRFINAVQILQQVFRPLASRKNVPAAQERSKSAPPKQPQLTKIKPKASYLQQHRTDTHQVSNPFFLLLL